MSATLFLPSFVSRIALVYMVAIMLLNYQQADAKQQDLNPHRKSSSAELPVDEEFHPVSGTYYYDVFLKKVRIGKATISVKQEGDEYIIQVAAKTRNMLSNLYKVRYRGEATLNPDPIQPLTATIEEEVGTKNKTFKVQFPAPNKVTAVQFESKDGKEPTRKENEFESESFVLDPFSTVFLIRSLKWKAGDIEVFDVFTGKKQYELQLYCLEETILEINGEQRKAWKILPQTRTLTEPQKIKMSNFVIYLSNDPQREILKITGDPKIGRIVARMRKFDELP